MQLIGLVLLLGCAEWALIFRTWVSFRYLFLYAGVAALRLYYFFHFFPHWDANYVLLPVSLLAVLYHLRTAWRGGTSHNQQTYNTPETGVPWLAVIAQNRKRAQFLEYLIMTAFVWYLASYGRIVYPPGFLTLSPAWRTWFISPNHAWNFAILSALGALFSYSLWNLAVSGVPFLRPREPASSESPYRHVREESHRSPRLPSVKELSDDIGDFYN
jgi:hypothetical protein